MSGFAVADLTPLLQQVVKSVEEDAASHGVRVLLSGCCPPCPHNPEQLSTAIGSLLRQSLMGAKPGDTIHVELRSVGGSATVTLVLKGETGGRLPPPSESALEIARLVAEMHGGRLFEEEQPAGGMLCRLEFPLERRQSSSRRTDVMLAAVHRIATRLFDRPELDDLLPEVILAGMEGVGATAGTIWLHDPADDTLVFRHGIGDRAQSLHGVRIKSSQGVAGAVFQSGRPVVTADPEHDPRHVELAANFQTNQLATLPLRNPGGKSIGVLQVLNRADGRGFSADHDLVILETLASLAATAISNAHLVEQRRKAAVADAVGDIAHDLKNIMSSLEAWAQMLEPLVAPARDELDKLKRRAGVATECRTPLDDALEMLPDVIRSVKSQSQEVQDRGAEIADALRGRIRQPIFVTENVIRTLDRARRALLPLAQYRDVELFLEGSCPPFPHDRTHVFHAAYNLVMNAISHTPAGGKITISLHREDEFAAIVIADTGRGMPPEVRDSLFTEKAISRSRGGSGLGTLIVGRVARIHSGQVSVKSAPGEGTVVTLRLALNPEPPTESQWESIVE